jgi:hypothetical protein
LPDLKLKPVLQVERGGSAKLCRGSGQFQVLRQGGVNIFGRPSNITHAQLQGQTSFDNPKARVVLHQAAEESVEGYQFAQTRQGNPPVQTTPTEVGFESLPEGCSRPVLHTRAPG